MGVDLYNENIFFAIQVLKDNKMRDPTLKLISDANWLARCMDGGFVKVEIGTFENVTVWKAKAFFLTMNWK